MSFTLEDKLRMLEYADTHSIKETVEAVKLNGKSFSDKTLYRWRSQRKKLVEAFKPLRLLRPQSRKPHKVRQSEYDLRISDYIIHLRKTLPIMGKEKVFFFVKEYCENNNIRMVSESTIGRIIKKLKENHLLIEYKQVKMMQLDGSTGKLVRKQTIKKTRKPSELKATEVGDIIQFDTVTIQVHNKKTYFINAIKLTHI
jgi:hypothetical protein